MTCTWLPVCTSTDSAELCAPQLDDHESAAFLQHLRPAGASPPASVPTRPAPEHEVAATAASSGSSSQPRRTGAASRPALSEGKPRVAGGSSAVAFAGAGSGSRLPPMAAAMATLVPARVAAAAGVRAEGDLPTLLLAFGCAAFVAVLSACAARACGSAALWAAWPGKGFAHTLAQARLETARQQQQRQRQLHTELRQVVVPAGALDKGKLGLVLQDSLKVVDASEQAALQGWRAGDQIFQVNGVRVDNKEQFLAEVERAKRQPPAGTSSRIVFDLRRASPCSSSASSLSTLGAALRSSTDASDSGDCSSEERILPPPVWISVVSPPTACAMA
eukprot:TRINITY_DN54288_c0_g1_i1.p1 TRINITY_DN54288_c0_g1~~TRINITY_DN54288_c0_g1_i1.p1  ORF type:complete len:381 (+),score=77.08 TRINITY_DN54288_c0_g1_i1:146-1144(+)